MILLRYYANPVVENAEKFKEFTDYMVADAYFFKKTFADAVCLAGMHLISRLRDDSVLKYRYTGEPTGKKGAPGKYNGKVDVKNFDTNYFSMDLCNEDIQIYSALLLFTLKHSKEI